MLAGTSDEPENLSQQASDSELNDGDLEDNSEPTSNDVSDDEFYGDAKIVTNIFLFLYSSSLLTFIIFLSSSILLPDPPSPFFFQKNLFFSNFQMLNAVLPFSFFPFLPFSLIFLIIVFS